MNKFIEVINRVHYYNASQKKVLVLLLRAQVDGIVTSDVKTLSELTELSWKDICKILYELVALNLLKEINRFSVYEFNSVKLKQLQARRLKLKAIRERRMVQRWIG